MELDTIDQIIHGNTLSVLNTLPSESIDCCITSPPYWGLRDYGIEGQLGLEPTFQEYITNLQTIFNEVRRVLKKTGTCWVNIGDTYSGTRGSGNDRLAKHALVKKINDATINAKSLCNIPFRFAISMTDSGWIQRNTIIWHKPSCMPSSAKDRFTVDFEYVFLFSKSKRYYFEQQFEAQTEDSIKNHGGDGSRTTIKYLGKKVDGKNLKEYERPIRILPNGRNKRTVWRINPQPFKDAHFAVFPEKLVEPMIKAGCPSSICDSCGRAYGSDITHKYKIPNKLDIGKYSKSDGFVKPSFTHHVCDRATTTKKRNMADLKEYLNNARKRAGYTIDEVEAILESRAPHHWFNGESYPSADDWQRIKKLFTLDKTYNDTLTCDCNAPTHAGIVLDPFVGSGTTALVARKLQRHYIGIDLNEDYCEMARKRLSEVL